MGALSFHIKFYSPPPILNGFPVGSSSRGVLWSSEDFVAGEKHSIGVRAFSGRNILTNSPSWRTSLFLVMGGSGDSLAQSLDGEKQQQTNNQAITTTTATQYKHLRKLYFILHTQKPEADRATPITGELNCDENRMWRGLHGLQSTLYFLCCHLFIDITFSQRPISPFMFAGAFPFFILFNGTFPRMCTPFPSSRA